jgi:hypothetical protein|tara:strand:- start:1341 stop:1742 length:402 start_codon:yes stop_codon:yes gene_type:complete
MALIGDTESRPGLIGYEETNKSLYSEIETETSKKILQEYEQTYNPTVFDLTLNDIIENTANMAGDFSNDYMLKIHEVNLESKLYGDEESVVKNFQKYIVAFMLYLGDKNNLLYFGIILVIISIILYFFNIASR